MEVLNETEITPATHTIDLRIRAEEGFNPLTDLDISSLRFGSHTEVNYGRGCKPIRSKASGNDIIVTFKGKGSGITPDEFAPKLIGKDTRGNMVFGYARLPYVDYQPALLSARRPKYNKETGNIEVKIENFGLTTSAETDIEVTFNGTSLGQAHVSPLEPYDATTLTLPTSAESEQGTYEVIFLSGEKEIERNTFAQ